MNARFNPRQEDTEEEEGVGDDQLQMKEMKSDVGFLV
jgi:hypothetical protein